MDRPDNAWRLAFIDFPEPHFEFPVQTAVIEATLDSGFADKVGQTPYLNVFEFKVWVPADLKDVGEIERHAVRAVRRDLQRLLSLLPADPE